MATHQLGELPFNKAGFDQIGRSHFDREMAGETFPALQSGTEELARRGRQIPMIVGVIGDGA
ncbi:MAG: hypothetical protein V1495_00230 [Pseudomonadota bacterium]